MRRQPIRTLLLLAVPMLLAACASMDRTTEAPQIPNGAIESTHTESNGDVVSEYRVQGQVRMVKVQPARGVTYYMVDSNGDGRLDRSKGEVAPVYYKLYSW